MKIGKYNYNRVGHKMPCPVCGRTKYCLVADGGEFVICTSEKSKKEYKTYRGWLHCLSSGTFVKPLKIHKTKDFTPNLKHIEIICNSLDKSQHQLKPLAINLNVGTDTLRDMGAGYKDDVWYFPMYNANKEMIGLKKRNLKGQKWCEKHSRMGVYLSKSFMGNKPVYVFEGESDTATALGLGLNAIGRASDGTSKDILVKLLNDCPDIMIVSDYDSHGSGYKQSQSLAGKLNRCDRYVSIAMNRSYKDFREWVASRTYSLSRLIQLSELCQG